MKPKLKISPKRSGLSTTIDLDRVARARANAARPKFNDKFKPRRSTRTDKNLKPIPDNT